MKHYAYYELISSRDGDNTSAREALENIEKLCSEASAGAKKALLSSSPTASWTKPYAYLRLKAKRDQAHSFAQGSDALAESSARALERFERLYGLTLRAADFATIQANTQSLNAFFDYKTLMALPDASIRQAAWNSYWSGLQSSKQILANILLGITEVKNGRAIAQGYPNAADAAYSAMGLTVPEVSATILSMQHHSRSLKAYQALLGAADSADQRETVPPWDVAASEGGQQSHLLSLSQLQQIARRATRRLGATHSAEIAAVLDPNGHRMDFSTRQGARAMDAFSITAPGVSSVLFVGYRRPDLESDVEVVHEAAHAVHGQLMNAQGTSPLNRNGAPWLMEAFAILDELLFREQLVREAKDPDRQEYYLRSLVDDLALQLFTSAEEAQLEDAIYRGVLDGKIGSSSELDELTRSILCNYELWPRQHPELAGTWESKRLFYQDPLYLANYLYAGLIAVKLYALSQENDAGFRQRYATLLGRGFEAEPGSMIEELLGEKLDWVQLVNDDVRIFDSKVAQLRTARAARLRFGYPSAPSRHAQAGRVASDSRLP
ncbi:hypothetical protein XhyaCFBP1156_08130 [Xanthomonas hyacinthi]|uniref:Peptidase M3A/M3B catalytic domain-containing protein n=1 Tax=Xanthomonas hyacinthi TaxID=56455 RepID=A0A2S7EYN1_9XANT|nr:hypothetical protein XhyaCFBP1156_08130 [Xanthomonas hyacinthi]